MGAAITEDMGGMGRCSIVSLRKRGAPAWTRARMEVKARSVRKNK